VSDWIDSVELVLWSERVQRDGNVYLELSLQHGERVAFAVRRKLEDGTDAEAHAAQLILRRELARVLRECADVVEGIGA